MVLLEGEVFIRSGEAVGIKLIGMLDRERGKGEWKGFGAAVTLAKTLSGICSCVQKTSFRVSTYCWLHWPTPGFLRS